MLLLLDLRLAAWELPESTIAFSLSMALRAAGCAPTDLRVRRTSGKVRSVVDCISATAAREADLMRRWHQLRTVAGGQMIGPR